MDCLNPHAGKMARRKPRDYTPLYTGSGMAALLLWSTTIALSRSLSERLGPITAAAAVYLVGGVFCLIRLLWQRSSFCHMIGLPRNYLAGCGGLFLLYSVLLYMAVGLARDREQALEVGLINYLWPALTILFSLLVLKQRFAFILWPGTALALSGLFLVMTPGSALSWKSFLAHAGSNPAPDILALAAAISWALYSNLTRRWAGENSAGAVELFIPATGLVLLAMLPFTTEPAAWNWRAVGEVIVLGGVTALAYALWDGAMRRGNLMLVAACSYFTPLLSTLVSCIYLRVMPGPKLWIGCLLLVGGSLLSWRGVRNEE